ncbi:MAG TPA: hypothetical protein VD927_10185 [Chryseosolibacter sp.]|nr:hypothetical protein [Chryseosolibacter sp.]
MKTNTLELPIVEKAKITNEKKDAAPAASGCCTPKDTSASACCTPSETPQDNGGACCAQPEDGSACCNK